MKIGDKVVALYFLDEDSSLIKNKIYTIKNIHNYNNWMITWIEIEEEKLLSHGYTMKNVHLTKHFILLDELRRLKLKNIIKN